jgi:hypothetical protein
MSRQNRTAVSALRLLEGHLEAGSTKHGMDARRPLLPVGADALGERGEYFFWILLV